MRILILYTELAGYVLGNINRFLDSSKESKLLLIHYPVNKEAPFKLSALPRTEFIEFSYEKQEVIMDRIIQFNPEIVLCSGWSNSFYLKIIKSFSKHVKKIICFDNQWNSSLKQNIFIIFSRFYLLKMFQFAWVPGIPQKKYALKLGFKKINVFTGLYPADTTFFKEIGRKKLESRGAYPKNIISVARYIPQKDLPTLWKAFINANALTGNQWKLNCIGLGELYSERIKNENIHHLGFKQPSEMETYIIEAGIYVLPSIEEPWGVAVHEMALSALPMVLSNKVGAASMFLNQSNGFLFQSGDINSLEKILVNMMRMSDNQLYEMAAKSFENGQKLLSEDWSKTLWHIYNTNK